MKKLLLNIFLAGLARFLLYLLSVPLLVIGTVIVLIAGGAVKFYRLLAIVLDIVGNVLGGPVWNIIFFKKGAKPACKFGGVITMSYVFALNVDKGVLNGLGMSICRFLEKRDPGHLKRSENPTYLFTHYPFPN